MKPTELTIRIELDNDAMLPSFNVAEVLRKVALRIQENQYLEYFEEEITRGIMDENGNTIGRWSLR